MTLPYEGAELSWRQMYDVVEGAKWRLRISAVKVQSESTWRTELSMLERVAGELAKIHKQEKEEQK